MRILNEGFQLNGRCGITDYLKSDRYKMSLLNEEKSTNYIDVKYVSHLVRHASVRMSPADIIIGIVIRYYIQGLK